MWYGYVVGYPTIASHVSRLEELRLEARDREAAITEHDIQTEGMKRSVEQEHIPWRGRREQALGDACAPGKCNCAGRWRLYDAYMARIWRVTDDYLITIGRLSGDDLATL